MPTPSELRIIVWDALKPGEPVAQSVMRPWASSSAQLNAVLKKLENGGYIKVIEGGSRDRRWVMPPNGE